MVATFVICVKTTHLRFGFRTQHFGDSLEILTELTYTCVGRWRRRGEEEEERRKRKGTKRGKRRGERGKGRERGERGKGRERGVWKGGGKERERWGRRESKGENEDRM